MLWWGEHICIYYTLNTLYTIYIYTICIYTLCTYVYELNYIYIYTIYRVQHNGEKHHLLSHNVQCTTLWRREHELLTDVCFWALSSFGMIWCVLYPLTIVQSPALVQTLWCTLWSFFIALRPISSWNIARNELHFLFIEKIWNGKPSSSFEIKELFLKRLRWLTCNPLTCKLQSWPI